MSDVSKWLEETKWRAIAISEAYQRQLDKLWWANLCFVVLPAVCSTAAAIFAALPNEKAFGIFTLPITSILAGSSAILIAVHKALKCEEYQSECLRLSQAYQSIAISADSALSGAEEEHVLHQKRLTTELEDLSKNAKAQVSSNYMNKPKHETGDD